MQQLKFNPAPTGNYRKLRKNKQHLLIVKLHWIETPLLDSRSRAAAGAINTNHIMALYQVSFLGLHSTRLLLSNLIVRRPVAIFGELRRFLEICYLRGGYTDLERGEVFNWEFDSSLVIMHVSILGRSTWNSRTNPHNLPMEVPSEVLHDLFPVCRLKILVH
jgi:hypothetical protein